MTNLVNRINQNQNHTMTQGSDKKETINDTARAPESLWRINEKWYDLEGIMKWHPGGKLPVKASMGIVNATPAFMMYHAFCDMKSIERMLEKYEYVGPVKEWAYKPKPLRKYTYAEDGFYRTVLYRVRQTLDGNINKSQRKHIKGGYKWWARFVFLVFLYAMLFTFSHASKTVAFLLGFTMVLVGFNAWHDIHHNAGPINLTLHKISSIISTFTGSLFDIEVWAIHHNIKHHSFTGARYHDPDDETWANVVPGIITLMFAQPLQCLMYLKFRLSGKKSIWYINRPEWLNKRIGETTLAPVVHHLILSLYAGIGASIMCGVGASVAYMSLVWADHFMPDTAADSEEIYSEKNIKKTLDWGEGQVRASGNFFPNSPFLDAFCGGMNYQIEHHLFPSMNSEHYSTIAPIVKQTAQEFDIPYRVTPSYFNILSHILSQPGSLALKVIACMDRMLKCKRKSSSTRRHVKEVVTKETQALGGINTTADIKVC
jgi:linoleoyl-CoA desaturase